MELFLGDFLFAAFAINGIEYLVLLLRVGHQLGKGGLAAALILVIGGDISPVVFRIIINGSLLLFGKGKTHFQEFFLCCQILTGQLFGFVGYPGQAIIAFNLLIEQRKAGVHAFHHGSALHGSNGKTNVHARGDLCIGGAIGPAGICTTAGQTGGQGQGQQSGG